MSRRTAIALFLLFGLWTAWTFSKEVTVFRSTVLDPRTGAIEDVYVYCGNLFPILWDGEYFDDAPHFFHGPCLKAARGHFVQVIMLGGTAIGFLIAGLTRRKGPVYVDIDTVLRPLPTVAELHSKSDLR